MTAAEYILAGLEAELALERELGVKTVEIDRSLLQAGTQTSAPTRQPQPERETRAQATAVPTGRPVVSRPAVDPLPDEASPAKSGTYDFVFLHDRPLSEKGTEMMAKIIRAMGKTAETAPVIVAPPVPKAKVRVVLGGLALRKFCPGAKGEPGQWIKSANGTDTLVTYSPEYILRFATVTPAVEKIKKAMWLSLKAVTQRSR